MTVADLGQRPGTMQWPEAGFRTLLAACCRHKAGLDEPDPRMRRGLSGHIPPKDNRHVIAVLRRCALDSRQCPCAKAEAGLSRRVVCPAFLSLRMSPPPGHGNHAQSFS